MSGHSKKMISKLIWMRDVMDLAQHLRKLESQDLVPSTEEEIMKLVSFLPHKNRFKYYILEDNSICFWYAYDTNEDFLEYIQNLRKCNDKLTIKKTCVRMEKGIPDDDFIVYCVIRFDFNVSV